MSEWQPIETAPIDSLVLLYCPNRDLENYNLTNGERIELDYATTSTGSHHSWATHWMPLPNPPKE